MNAVRFYLKQGDVVVVRDLKLILRMGNYPLDFELLAEISMGVPSGDAELYRPTDYVRVAEMSNHKANRFVLFAS